METIALIPAQVNPASINPRDSWPAWTDEDRWVSTTDGPRPTAGPDFLPTVADDAEATAILNDDGLAEYAAFDEYDRFDEVADFDADWDAFQAERAEGAFADPFDLVSPEELIECRGYHPAAAYDL